MIRARTLITKPSSDVPGVASQAALERVLVNECGRPTAPLDMLDGAREFLGSARECLRRVEEATPEDQQAILSEVILELGGALRLLTPFADGLVEVDGDNVTVTGR